jgi:hypothetical protein
MRTRIWAIGLTGFFLCAGCGQQDSIVQSEAITEKEIADAGEATHADRAAPAAVQVAHKWSLERLSEDQNAVAQKAIEDGVYDAQVGIRVSGRAERDAYENARLRATRELGISADR